MDIGKIDSTAQIILSVGIVISIILLLGLIFHFILKKGLKVAFGKLSANIGGTDTGILLTGEKLEMLIEIIIESMEDVISLNNNEALDKKMAFAQDKIPLIRNLKEQIFYKLSKDKIGDNEVVLTENEDLDYYICLISNALFADNGSTCLKSVLRKYLKGVEYKKEDREFDNFLNDFTELACENWRRYINLYYKTDVITDNGGRRTRIVSQKELYHANNDRKHKDDLEDIFRQVFTFAKNIDNNIEKEHEVLYRKRQNKIKQLLGIANEKT